MGYERDKDRMTRGVGAIAAADHSLARYRRRVQEGQATRRRDRAMAAVAMGALGRVSMVADSPRGGEKRGSGSGKLYVPPPPPPRHLPPVISPPATTGASTTTTAPIATPVVVTRPPVAVPPVVLPPSSGGGGGGGVMPTGGQGQPTVFDPLPPLPDDAIPVSPVHSAPNTNLLLWGGAALAAYFLFFRKESP